MQARDANLLDLLKLTHQFEVPIYQRAYAWQEDECEQLWRDLLRAGADEAAGSHFTGSVVYVRKAAGTTTSQQPNLLIDGQQRVTTLTLILIALAERLGYEPQERQEPEDGFSPDEIRESFLINRLKSDERRYKLRLSEADRQALQSAVDGEEPPAGTESRIIENLAMFRSKLREPSLDFSVVCRGLARLQVVDVELELGVDHPQLVFEAMNSTGRKLSQADLIRNFVLMDLPLDEQTRLWRAFWRPMELEFAKEQWRFDGFIRDFLTVATGSIPRQADLYEAFKGYAFRRRTEDGTIESLVIELRENARNYARMVLRAEPEPTLREAFEELAQIRAEVVYPFLLEAYRDYELGSISTHEMVQIVRMVISYIFRRAVVGLATNSLNRTFQMLGRSLQKDRYVDSVKASFLRMAGYRTFPTDAEFEERLRTFDAYHFKRKGYLLRSLENAGRKERVQIDEYTIEHIMPQNDNLRAEWKAALGADWREVQERYLHTLGNLTLTGYNSEYSDRPFAEKRDMRGGFRESPLKLNEGLGALDSWNADTIESRADRLAKRAIELWPRPHLDAGQLDQFEEKRSAGRYTIEHHPHLLRPARRAQFDALSAEVLALDPAVTMEYLKVRVTYRAEDTFLDVIPQAARLVLVLNIPASELRDEKGLARDVSAIGHWGVGDTQVPFHSEEDLEYVMGLVRQAYEYAMADD